MAGTPALRPTAKRFSPILHQHNLREIKLKSFSSILPAFRDGLAEIGPPIVREISRRAGRLLAKNSTLTSQVS
jgi:hypothetical protein